MKHEALLNKMRSWTSPGRDDGDAAASAGGGSQDAGGDEWRAAGGDLGAAADVPANSVVTAWDTWSLADSSPTLGAIYEKFIGWICMKKKKFQFNSSVRKISSMFWRSRNLISLTFGRFCRMILSWLSILAEVGDLVLDVFPYILWLRSQIGML